MISDIILKSSLLFYILNDITGQLYESPTIQQNSVDLKKSNREKSNIIHNFWSKFLIIWLLFLFFRIIFPVLNSEFSKWVSWKKTKDSP